MITKRKFIAAALSLVLAGPAWLTPTTTHAAGPAAKPCRPGSSACPVQPLSAAESDTLTFMREEEKMARDVYLTLNKIWGLPPFSNIAAAEQKHMDAVKAKLDKYRLPDPAQTAIGDFQDKELEKLYDKLLARGDDTYLDALWVGGLIEEMDIEDLEDAIAATTQTDLAQVYASLLCGSRNHLRAFAATIERHGLVYEAQHLDQEVVDAIIDSPMERRGACGGGGGGKR
ncbi:MAG: DUF2202 domain-containing protein [Gammaproteobacteria bacterium]|nr:MAG: DUF2202 domain-containing protein [Gammaproteobacteria bacterium]